MLKIFCGLASRLGGAVRADGIEPTSKGLIPMIRSGSKWLVEVILVDMLYRMTQSPEMGDCALLLEDAEPQEEEIEIGEPNETPHAHIIVRSQWLGDSTGKDVRINYGGQIANLHESINSVCRKPNPAEQAMTPSWCSDSTWKDD